MKFDELFKILAEDFGVSKLSDVARELNVSPQVINNWKNNNNVPYKYVLELRKKLEKNNQKINQDNSRTYIIEKEATPQLEGFTITDLLNYVIKPVISEIRKILVFVILVCSTSFLYVTYFMDPTYESKSKIITLSGTKSEAAGLASRFGLNIKAESENDIISGMVPDLLRTRTLASSLLKQRFNTAKYGDSLSLIDIYKIKLNSTDTEFVKNIAIDDILTNKVEIKNSNFSPFIEITTSAVEAKFAHDINERIISELQKVLNEFKSSRNEEKIKFIIARFNEVNLEVKKAEERLKDFREKNRSITKSPALLLEQDRIIRDLDVKSEIYTTLKQEHELLQIEKVANEKNIMVIETPTTPLNRTSPRRIDTLIISFILSIFFASSVVIVANKYDLKKIFLNLKNL